MARSFNGSTDKITSTLATGQKGLTTQTYHCAIKRASAGEVGYGSVFTTEVAAARRFIFQNDNGDAGFGLYFQAPWTTTSGGWSVAYPGDTNYHWYTITYDGSATTNNPVWYKDGVSVTVTTRFSPAGTFRTDETDLIIGNRSNQTETWDGTIAEFAKWDRILTAAEIDQLGKGYSPLFIPRGLVLYMPIIGNYSPEIELRMGSNGTLTGTTKVPHPRIIYPNNAQFIFPPAAVAAPAAGVQIPTLLMTGVG